MSQEQNYHDYSLLETVDGVLNFSVKFVKYYNMLSEIESQKPEYLDLCAELVEMLGDSDELAGLAEFMSRPGDLTQQMELRAIKGVDEVKEVELMFRVFQYFGIPLETVISTICANPYGYLTSLKKVFQELRTDRPLTFEEDLIIAFRSHRVSYFEAVEVLHLKNATIRKVWKKAVKQKMARALEEVKREREAKKGEGNGGYHHLSPGERLFIMLARIQGLTQKQIAEMLGRNPSTISREVRRLEPQAYGPMADYTCTRACNDYKTKRKACGRKDKLEMRDSEGKLITTAIRELIVCKKFSPEQIVFGVFRKNENIYFDVSKSTIYNWINNGKIYGLSRDNLRYKGKKRKKYSSKCEKYSKGTSILERPDYVNDRSEFGHFEADSVVSCRNGKGRVFTLVERKTRYFIGKVVIDGTADNFVNFIKMQQKRFGFTMKSITVDNGSEFAGWEKIEELGIKIYFSRPYCSNDKGTIEHHNGLLREFFPKKTDFSQVHQKTLDMKCVRLINMRPRKVLNWVSAQEAFHHEIELLKKASAA